MKINITYPNKALNFDFRVECFLINEENEVFAIGWDFDKNQYTALGFFQEEDGRLYFYYVKQMGQLFYENVIKGGIGESFELKSDISTGFWTEIQSLKVKSKYFFDMLFVFEEEGFYLGDKTGFGLMKPGEEVRLSDLSVGMAETFTNGEKTVLLKEAKKINFDFKNIL